MKNGFYYYVTADILTKQKLQKRSLVVLCEPGYPRIDFGLPPGEYETAICGFPEEWTNPSKNILLACWV